MANRILGVLFKKKYANGDTDTIYPKTRAQDVTTSGGATLETIATKVNGMQEGATKVAKSSTNGNILINGAQTVVYTHPNSGATAGTYNKVTINAQGHVTSGSNVTDWTGTVSGDVSNGTVTSEQSSSRSNLASGEKLSVSMGKIRKWLADLKSLAFVDKVGTSNLDSTLTTFYNNRVTTDKVTQSTSITEAGWVADARVIRTLQNQINTLNSKATTLENELNSKITYFFQEIIDTTGQSFDVGLDYPDVPNDGTLIATYKFKRGINILFLKCSIFITAHDPGHTSSDTIVLFSTNWYIDMFENVIHQTVDNNEMVYFTNGHRWNRTTVFKTDTDEEVLEFRIASNTTGYRVNIQSFYLYGANIKI